MHAACAAAAANICSGAAVRSFLDWLSLRADKNYTPSQQQIDTPELSGQSYTYIATSKYPFNRLKLKHRRSIPLQIAIPSHHNIIFSSMKHVWINTENMHIKIKVSVIQNTLRMCFNVSMEILTLKSFSCCYHSRRELSMFGYFHQTACINTVV